MDKSTQSIPAYSVLLLGWLACLMFFMFAMTDRAVGNIIPSVIDEFDLDLKLAGTFHYIPMVAMGLSAILLGFLVDRFGRKVTIVFGLSLYGLSCFLFIFSEQFSVFMILLATLGVGISIFKIGALALVGDISPSVKEHTSLMNKLEGFFSIGAITGPALVVAFIMMGISWKTLYLCSAFVCLILAGLALFIKFPIAPSHKTEAPASISGTINMMKNPYALGFSVLIMLCVAVEAAIYVWMPSYLSTYQGPFRVLSEYSVSFFFAFRGLGCFFGVWLMRHYSWTISLTLLSAGIVICYIGALIGGVEVGIFLLPISGLFIAMQYPTLNSKSMNCFSKSEHGTAAGIFLFFTSVAAALGPLSMAAVSDAYNDLTYGFILATGFAFLLFIGLLYNSIYDLTKSRLVEFEEVEYK